MDNPVILSRPYESGMRVVCEIFCFLNVEYWLVEFLKLEKDAKPFAFSYQLLEMLDFGAPCSHSSISCHFFKKKEIILLTEIKILQQGQLDPELNEIGRQQALVVWFIFSNCNSELIIVCSSMTSNAITFL